MGKTLKNPIFPWESLLLTHDKFRYNRLAILMNKLEMQTKSGKKVLTPLVCQLLRNNDF